MGKAERKKSERMDMTVCVWFVSNGWMEWVLGICGKVYSRAWEMIIRSSWPFEKHFPGTLSFQALSR